MQIQINTDHNIKGSRELETDEKKFEDIVLEALTNFKKHITRIEIHFSDVNAGKIGFEDKRCLIEARVSGVKPIISIHTADSLILALDGATDKLKNSLTHVFGKMKKH